MKPTKFERTLREKIEDSNMIIKQPVKTRSICKNRSRKKRKRLCIESKLNQISSVFEPRTL